MSRLFLITNFLNLLLTFALSQQSKLKPTSSLLCYVQNCQKCSLNNPNYCEKCFPKYILLLTNPYQCLKSTTQKSQYSQNGVSSSVIYGSLSAVFSIILFASLFILIRYCHRKRLAHKNKSLYNQTINTFSTQPDPLPDLHQIQLYQSRDRCAICLQHHTNIRLSCTHQFHDKCLFLWLKKKHICPDCNNEKFQIDIMCKKCLRVRDKVEICGQQCRKKDHIVCFKSMNLRKDLCRECRREIGNKRENSFDQLK